MRATLPAGVVGPFFNDEFGDVYGSIYALSADGFSRAAAERPGRRVRQRLLRVSHVAKVEIFGAQDEKIFIEVPQKRWPQLGLDMNQVIAQIGQQNAVESARHHQRADRLPAGARGRPVQHGRGARAFADPRQRPRAASGSATSRRSAAPMSTRRRSRCATRARKVIALGISMAKGGDIIEMGRRCAARPMPSAPSCRWASSCASSRTSRPVCRALGGRVRARADRGGGDRAGGELRQPGAALRRASGSTGAPAWWWASRFRWCWPSPS